MNRLLHHLQFSILYTYAALHLVLLLSEPATTWCCWAFLEPNEMRQVVDFFQDTFLANGGQDFLLRLDRGEVIHAQDNEDFRALNDIFGISCLLESIRPDIESSPKTGAVPATAHKSAVLCLEAGPDCSDESKQITFVDKMDATGSEFRYLSENDGRPENQQGVFWTNSGTITGSLLLSYAKSRDGGMISNGVWKKDEFGVSYRLRPAGDRMWAVKGYNFYYVSLTLLDVIYALKINGGTDEEPTSWKTILTFSPNYFPLVNLFRVHIGECLSWILDLDTYFVEGGDDEFEGSAIWRRDTILFGQEARSYDLVQIVDGRGEPIQPAYSKWVESQRDPKKPSIPNGLIIETLDSYCDKVSKCDN